MDQSAVPQRKPRYLLGSFWLILGIVALITGVSDGQVGAIFLSFAMFAYAVYLYRGGRFGFIIW